MPAADALETAAAAIRSEFGVEVTPVAADFNSAEGRKRIWMQRADVDILVNNPGRAAGSDAL
jgi:3-oxoacyl-[acyl-carrier protein] reductase